MKYLFYYHFWCLFFPISYVQEARQPEGIWARLRCRNGNLIDAIERAKLLATRSLASSSVKKYTYYWTQFEAWASRFGFNCLPAAPEHVALYLADTSKKHSSGSVCNAHFYAIRWQHRLHGFNDPCLHQTPQMVLEGCRRDLSCRKAKSTRVPFPREILISLCEKFASNTASLRDLRICSMTVLSFAAFLRIGEILNLRRADIGIHEDYISIRVRRSKTDKYSKGSEVLISAGVTVACPKKILASYFEKAGLDSELTSECFIFRTLIKTSDGAMLISDGSRCLTYNRARDELAYYLECLGLERSVYGWHCLRHGGATAAAEAGVPDRLFKAHGRWQSEVAKDGYVHDSLRSKLSVSKALLL